MYEIAVFVEDEGHRRFILAILQRLAEERSLEIHPAIYSEVGGRGKMISELKAFIQRVGRGDSPSPDLIIVATDANCKGSQWRTQVTKITGKAAHPTVCAIPDPHVERWLLLDAAAFRQAVGRGCSAPDQKCDKDRYKMLLIDAVRAAGEQPLLGGLEYTEEIVRAMNLEHLESGPDQSLARFLKDLRTHLTRWTLS